MHIHTYAHTHIYIYIHTYIHTPTARTELQTYASMHSKKKEDAHMELKDLETKRNRADADMQKLVSEMEELFKVYIYIYIYVCRYILM